MFIKLLKQATRSALPLVVVSSAFAQSGSENSTEEVYNLPAFSVQGEQLGYNVGYGNTAFKLDVPILDTPSSLFVINDALIADQQAFRFDQILQNDASVQKRNNFLGAYSSHYIRGFNLQNGSNYLRNGQTFFHLASPPIEILERVEVLKGPTSVLYGTMSPGGMINMVSKSPLPEYAGTVKATIGSDSLTHIQVDTGGPIGEKVSYRIALASEDSESYRSFGNGESFDVSRKIAYIALDWDLAENTIIKFNADVTEDDRPQDIGLLTTADENGLELLGSLDYDTILSQPWTTYNSDVWNAGVELEHVFENNFELSVGYTYQSYKRDRYDNQFSGLYSEADAQVGDIIIRARHRINRYEYHTLFADLSGHFNTGNLEHTFLVGADSTTIDLDNNETSRNEFFITNIFNPVYVDDPIIPTSNSKNTGETVQDGLFIQDMIRFNEKWFAVGGLRYDDFVTNFSVAGTQAFEYGTNNISSRAGVVYKPTTNIAYYLSYSESFEPNAPVSDTGLDNFGEVLDPTLGEMIEIGSKWELLDSRLLVTGALFTIDRQGDPVLNETGTRIESSGLQRNQGMEGAITGLLNENLTVSASFTVLDAEYIKDNDESIIGNQPAGASDFATSLWGEYQFNEGILEGLSVHGGWFYESERPIDDVNTFFLDAFHRIDFGLKYTMPFNDGKRGMTYRLTASNVLDEVYFKGDSPTAINLERPREVRFSVQYTF